MMDIRKIRCTVPCAPMTAESGFHCAMARDEIDRLRAALHGICIFQNLDEDGKTMQDIARAALEVTTNDCKEAFAVNERLQETVERLSVSVELLEERIFELERSAAHDHR